MTKDKDVDTTTERPTDQPESPETAAKKAKARGEAEEDVVRFGAPPENLPSYEPAVPTRVTDRGAIRIEIFDLADKKQRTRFIDLPEPFYAGDPHYVSPLKIHHQKLLDPNKNPAFRNLELKALVAFDGNKPVARMTAHIDRAYNRYHESETGFFGFFESVNDRKVAHAILGEGMNWLKSKGMSEVFGPMNFTTNHTAGLLVENFDRPAMVEETYNPRYYEELLTSFGFGKAKDLLVWWIDIHNGMTGKNRERIARIAEKIQKREGVTIRGLDVKNVEAEREHLFELYVKAWEKNWGFVPLDKTEFTWLTNDLLEIVIPELVLFVECEGKVVGFCSTIPDVQSIMPKNGRLFPFGWWKLATQMKKIKEGRLYTLGMLPEFRKRGLESLMFAETVVRAQKVGFKHGEIGWTLEDNTLINRAIESMDGKIDRRYRILGMKL
jgi:hypothetical protein